MTKINIKHIAKLANFILTQDEEKKFESQLEAVLSHIEKLSEVDTKDVVETSQVTGLENVEKKDIVEECLPQSNAVSQAKNVHNGLFEVPVIIEEAVENI